MRALTLMVFLFALLFGAVDAYAQATIFPKNLSLGSSGPDVLALQQMLNADPDTRIASTGPGSPGNETGYFGALTKAAVIRFQEKYAGTILAPVGLTAGNGMVGMYTRAKLDALYPSPLPESASTTPPTPTPPTASTTVSTTSISDANPNAQNLPAYLAAVDSVGEKQGLSSSALATINQTITNVAATTTDLRAAFIQHMQQNSAQANAQLSFTQKILAFVENIFMPNRAYAAAVGIPFGGAITFALPCDDGVWSISITPLPPTFVPLLNYVTGSQLYLFHNLNAPHTGMELLGSYTVPGPGICSIGPDVVPAQGTISPSTGSSL